MTDGGHRKGLATSILALTYTRIDIDRDVSHFLCLFSWIVREKHIDEDSRRYIIKIMHRRQLSGEQISTQAISTSNNGKPLITSDNYSYNPNDRSTHINKSSISTSIS